MVSRRGCKKKKNKKVVTTALGKSKCLQFVKVVNKGKDSVRRKGGLEGGDTKGKGKKRGVAVDVLAHGGGFLLDDEAGGGDVPSNNFDNGSPRRSGSGLHLILEEAVSLVPETRMANIPGSSRKDLDASRIFSLQRSNGLVFSVRDKAITTKLVAMGDVEVDNNGRRVLDMSDQ